MVTTRPRGRRGTPDDVSPAGRIAGLTVGACLLLSAGAFLAASWDELRCTPAGERCDDVAGVGGAVSLAAAAVAIGGAVIVVTTLRRPVSESASSAWTWGLAVIFTIGTTLIAARIPGHSCPDGIHLTPIFNTCVDGARRFDATSWQWPKRALLVAGAVVGFTLIRSSRRVGITAAAAAIAWFAGTGWLLYDTMITGLPR